MEPSDEALVLACRQGNSEAWSALVDRYQRLIYTIARHAGLDEEQCADVFQRVFMTLVERLHTIEQPASVGAWLATTARHEAWRLSRREQRVRQSSAPDTAALPVFDDGPMPDEHLLRLEEQHKVRLMVDSLEKRCRDLLLMLFYTPDPLPYSAIASELGVSEGSIGPTRARCLQKLRRLLEDVDA